MNPPPKTYHSPLYRDFKEIDGNSFRTIVRFYEEYEEDIHGLKFEESFDLLVSYAHALFRTGAHQTFLRVADTILETSITEDIRFWNGEDIFYSTLLRKSACHHALLELETCDRVTRQLIGIDPTEKEAQMLLRRNFRLMRSRLVRNARAFCIICLLISAVVVLVEVLVVRSFYAPYLESVQALRTGIFLTGVGVLVLGDGYNYLSANWKTLRIVRSARQKKQK